MTKHMTYDIDMAEISHRYLKIMCFFEFCLLIYILSNMAIFEYEWKDQDQGGFKITNILTSFGI